LIEINVVRLGNAATLPEEHFTFVDFPNMGGCGTISQPVIEPDGYVYACCGPSRSSKRTSPLVLGNTFEEDLDSILHRATNDPLLEAILNIGPTGLYHLMKNEPDMQDLLPTRKRYTGVCELCLDMNNTPEIVQRLRERMDSDDIRKLLVAAHIYNQAAPELRDLARSTM
jgi:hypothetical protein